MDLSDKAYVAYWNIKQKIGEASYYAQEIGSIAYFLIKDEEDPLL